MSLPKTAAPTPFQLLPSWTVQRWFRYPSLCYTYAVLQHRNWNILAACLGVILAAYLLWPMPGASPWHDEISAENYRNLGRYARRVSRNDVARALEVVDPYQALLPFLDEYQDGYLRIIDRVADEMIDVVVPLAEEPLAPPEVSPSRNDGLLRGQVILLDPGHAGGAWSIDEQRHFATPRGLSSTTADRHETFAVREGDLNYAVAVLLKDRLEEAGARVILSRGPPPSDAFSDSTLPGYDWQEESALWLAHQLAAGNWPLWQKLEPARVARWKFWRARNEYAQDKPFELFNRYDLRRRGLMAERENVDITVSVHHNTSLDGKYNGVIVFAPGNFLSDELQTPSDRYYAFRRILDGSLPASKQVARAIGTAMQQHFQLPPLPFNAGAPGIANKVTLDPAAGAFARNLALTKRALGPVVLVEGPCMNHPEEFVRLQGTQLLIAGRAYPQRVQSYADAVFEGLSQSAPWWARRR